MNKMQIQIDLSKLDKTKITEREVTINGVVTKQKLYKIDAIPLKSPKLVKEGDTWILNKTGFLVEPQTKDERAAKKESIFLGDCLEFDTK